MKVLILSCSTGGGHNSCAKYIEEELKLNNIKCEFKNFYDIVNTSGNRMTEKIYLNSLKENGKAFRNIYKLGELYSKSGVTSPVYLVNKMHARRLYNYIKNGSFDLIITTHLFPSLTLTAIKKHYDKNLKFIAISTDYEPCPFIEETMPNYLIMQKGQENRYIEKGCNKDILYSSGIPVSSRFVFRAKNIRNELGIGKDEKTILVMLGSMGFGKIYEIIDDVLNQNKCKVIVVCGSNKKLYNELVSMNRENLIVFGFVNNINDLIHSSDIVMSKPGGLSSTEITCMRKPLIHIYPIPGIETYNTNFFEGHGMSLKCNTREEILDTVHELLNNKHMQEKMIKFQEKYINNKSASDLIKLIIDMKLK